MRNLGCICLFVLLCLCTALLGCGDFGTGLDDGDLDTKSCDQIPTDMNGVWKIKGTGSRWSCKNADLDTDHFDLASPALKFVQTTNEQGQITFTLGTSITGFELRGEVDCVDVDFETTERFGGEEISYDFDGRESAFGDVKGDFDATGPGSCKGEGEFTLEKQ